MISVWFALGFAQTDPGSLRGSLSSTCRTDYLVLFDWGELSEGIKSVTIFINKELIKILHKNFPLREKLREPTRCHRKQLAVSLSVSLVHHSDWITFNTSLRLAASPASLCFVGPHQGFPQDLWPLLQHSTHLQPGTGPAGTSCLLGPMVWRYGGPSLQNRRD